MKQVGVVRRIDDLGRVVIPKEIRTLLNLKNGELLNIMVNDDSILLKKETESMDVYCTIFFLAGVFKCLYDDVVVITNRDSIIKSENIELKNLSLGNLSEFVDNFSNYVSIGCDVFEFGGKLVEGYYYVTPIFLNSIYYGHLVTISKSKSNLFLYENICKFILKIIENKFVIA